MQPFNKPGDQLNPSVSMDPVTGNMVISGKSIPLDEREFLADIMSWLERYLSEPCENTNLEINLKYLNGKSIRSLLTILGALKQLNDRGGKVNVDWTIPKDAEDLQDLSEQVLSDFHIPHRIKLN